MFQLRAAQHFFYEGSENAITKHIKIILSLLMLVLCSSIFYVIAYAYNFGENNSHESGREILSVSAAWLEGDMLRVDVVNEETGAHTSLAIRLADYVNPMDNSPYISVQAVDLEGNRSGIIRIQNPFYIPASTLEDLGIEVPGIVITTGSTAAQVPASNQGYNLGQAPGGLRPFTPDGTGTVMDNATNDDGKEFFTITTDDGNEFFLIVDRHRQTDNVYLLNTVTEEDLMALARRSGREIVPSDPVITETPGPPTPPVIDTVETERPPAPPNTGTDNSLIIILAAAALAGGAAYYFKIVKKKKTAQTMDFFDEEEDSDWNDEGSDEDAEEDY